MMKSLSLQIFEYNCMPKFCQIFVWTLFDYHILWTDNTNYIEKSEIASF